MNLPPEVMEGVAMEVGELQDVSPVTAGCIGSAGRITAGGQAFFLKYGRPDGAGFFGVEAAGLEALRSAARGDILVPEVIACTEAEDGWGWILLEWLEPAPPTKAHWIRLGAGLAELHRTGADDGWGWERDGFIGSLSQRNSPTTTWPEFWLARRLGPQLERARSSSSIGAPAEWDRLFDVLPGLLAPAEADRPSFVHGDLWHGNVLMTASGAAMVDPAFYRGHREVDLAMADLFGGFPSAFRHAYEEAWPLRSGHEVRARVYQLYYLLVHVNLFGSSYGPDTLRTLRTVLASV